MWAAHYRHSISLYANISNIRWDAPAADGTVSGCILPPNGGAMKTFEFKPTDSNRFEIANRLWALIGEAK